MSDLETPAPPAANRSPNAKRVLVLGATGTIGRATVRALVRAGTRWCASFGRAQVWAAGWRRPDSAGLLDGAHCRFGDVSDPASLARDGFRGERFDALVSCLASRTGAPKDAWAIDYQAHVHALSGRARKRASRRWCCCRRSACKSRCWRSSMPSWRSRRRSIESGLTYSIVRPTAFFKSLSGQVERVRRGKPFLVFGDGN